VAAVARRTVLPPDLFEQYAALSFWQNGAGSGANVIRPMRTASAVKK
jgi:sulfotransferase